MPWTALVQIPPKIADQFWIHVPYAIWYRSVEDVLLPVPGGKIQKKLVIGSERDIPVKDFYPVALGSNCPDFSPVIVA